jgi:hypothetical protein
MVGHDRNNGPGDDPSETTGFQFLGTMMKQMSRRGEDVAVFLLARAAS